MKRGILAGLIVLSLSGCATNQSLYEWGGYQHDLLKYSKNPGETKKFSEALMVDIQKAEAGHKVPPGLYAEYGYTLLDAGDVNGAVTYFGKERDRWPESAMLMNKVIGKLTKAPIAQSAGTNNGSAAQ